MRPSLLSLLLLLALHFNLYAQDTTEIKSDTAYAERLYEQAMETTTPDSLKVILLKQALDIYASHSFSPDFLRTKGTYLRCLIQTEDLSSSFVESEKENILLLAEQHLGSGLHPCLQETYLALITFYQYTDYELAVKYYQQFSEMTAVPSLNYFTGLTNITTAYAYTYRLEELEKMINTAENFIDEEPYRKFTPLIFRVKMQISYLRGNFEEAVIYGKQFFRSNALFNFYTEEEEGPICVEMGKAIGKGGNVDEGAEWIKKGISKSGYDNEDPRQGSYWANMATLYANVKAYDKAILYQQKSIDLFLKDKEKYGNLLRIMYSNISSSYTSIERPDLAEKNLVLSLSYGETPLGWLNYASILRRQEKTEDALTIVQKALAGLCPQVSPTDFSENPEKHQIPISHNLTGLILFSKFTYLSELAQTEKELDFTLQTGDLAEYYYKTKIKNVDGFSEAAFSFSEGLTDVYSYKLKVMKKKYDLSKDPSILPKIFEIIEARKSFSLVKTLSPLELPLEFAEKKKNISERLDILSGKVVTSPKDSVEYYEEELYSANQEYLLFKQELKSKFPKYFNNFFEIKYAKVEEIQGIIDDQTLVINYSYSGYKGDFNLYTHAIDKEREKLFYSPHSEDFRQNLFTLKSLLSNPLLAQKSKRDQMIKLSYEFYQNLIKPIEPMLEGKTKLVIIPEKTLFYLPFEILLSSSELSPYQDLNYLLNDYEITYHYSATAFCTLQKKEGLSDNSLLAFAPVFSDNARLPEQVRAADFAQDSIYRTIDDGEFTALPYTEQEVELIAESLSKKKTPTTVLTGKNASKSALIKSINSKAYQFIHIATHGLVNLSDPRLSALACYSSQKDQDFGSLFYANEIQALNLNADLVILSSCESGIGQLVSGEGLIALNRAFIYAGAKNVLSSLWKVNDFHTKDLMVDFYKIYAQGNHSYGSALRQAKLNMLKDPKTALPRYWAPFILMGR